MLRTYVSGKIHGLRITDKSLEYSGSASIDRRLLKEAGIEPHEQVHIVNIENGNRWITYAIPVDAEGEFSLNGAAARMGEVGDRCIVITYAMAATNPEAQVLFLDEANRIRTRSQYHANETEVAKSELVNT